MVDSLAYRFAAGEFVLETWCDVNIGSVLVADSWAVRDGRVVGLEYHLERFRRGCRLQGVEADIDRFLESVIARIPRQGAWFPRIEAVRYGDGALLRYLERPAPTRETEVIVATAAHDPRTRPDIKGPDLAALAALRTEAQGLGAGEAIICDSRGAIIEGAYSALWWWKNDRIFRPISALPRTDSVTDRVLRDHARLIGATITEVEASAQELAGCELWVLSALHGIRQVTEWVNGPELRTETGRAQYWRTCYNATLEALPAAAI